MSKKNSRPIPPIPFHEQTPDLLIEHEPPDPLYERAFLSPETQQDSEFSRNTTTWD